MRRPRAPEMRSLFCIFLFFKVFKLAVADKVAIRNDFNKAEQDRSGNGITILPVKNSKRPNSIQFRVNLSFNCIDQEHFRVLQRQLLFYLNLQQSITFKSNTMIFNFNMSFFYWYISNVRVFLTKSSR